MSGAALNTLSCILFAGVAWVVRDLHWLCAIAVLNVFLTGLAAVLAWKHRT